MVRLTADEMYDKIGMPGKGYDLEYGKKVAVELEKLGVDAINVTSACYDVYNRWLEPTSFEPGWRAYLAKEIKSVVNIPVCAANFIRSPEQAERQIAEGYQDFVGSARTFICDPHWVQKCEEGRPEDIKRCIGCLNCISSFMTNAKVGKNGECALNPAVGRERIDNAMPRDGEGKTAVIVGAGPAGLMAAEVLARRGFAVTVLEKNKEVGGQVNTAASCHLKGKLHWCIEDLMTNVTKLGVTVCSGVEVTADAVAEMKPDVVLLATGGVPVVPKSIPGIDKPHVCTAPEVILGDVRPKNKSAVVIGSGMTGLETAEILCETGNHVTVIEMADEIAPGNWFQLTDDEMERLSKTDTRFEMGTKLLAVDENGVLVEDVKSSEKRRIEADALVLSLGVKPAGDLARQLDRLSVRRIWRVGDAVKSGTIADACHSAFDTVMSIR